MKRFVLNRSEDVSGVSGTGTVAEGIEFGDGVVIISWLGEHHSLEIHPTLQSLLDIHGHGGKTTAEFLD